MGNFDEMIEKFERGPAAYLVQRAEKAEAALTAALGQVAALRNLLSSIDMHLGTNEADDYVLSMDPSGIGDLVEDTAAAAQAYEARIRRDERREVLEEIQNRLMLTTGTMAWIREQLAALDAESEGV
jgi:DNA-binding transcriptional regulator YbjK